MNLIKSVVTGEPTKPLRRRSNCKLGNTKSKCSRHILTTCVSVVLNNFMKKRLTTKSREASCDLFRGSASSPYNKIGTHLENFREVDCSYWTELNRTSANRQPGSAALYLHPPRRGHQSSAAALTETSVTVSERHQNSVSTTRMQIPTERPSERDSGADRADRQPSRCCSFRAGRQFVT